MAGLAAGVYQSDRALHVTVLPGHSLVVYGYLGEPLLRVGASGAAIATASPTAAAARLVVHGRSAVWHDVRTSSAHWVVPIRVDGRREAIAGVTRRLPKPSLPLWLAVVLALGVAAAAMRSAAGAGLVSAVAAIIVVAGFALSAYASPGTWIAGLDELAFALAGVGVLRWGPPVARLPASGWLCLVGVAVGLSKGQVFLHALVLSALPGTLMRVLAAAAIGVGAGGAVAAGIGYLRTAG